MSELVFNIKEFKKKYIKYLERKEKSITFALALKPKEVNKKAKRKRSLKDLKRQNTSNKATRLV